MQNLKPYLLFRGDCNEALNFYKELFSGEILFSTTYRESPLDIKDEDLDKVMHATFNFWGGQFMASDDVQGAHWTQDSITSNIQLSLGFTDFKDEEKVFAQLSEGGKVNMPLQSTFWGDYFGIATDRYGITWMLSGRKPETEK